MKWAFYIFTIVFLAFSIQTFSQNSDYEWFISPNVNLSIPIDNADKGVYPILWYDKETDPKLLIGGLGIGVTVMKYFKDKVSLKGQTNLSKHTYWDEPITMVDIIGQPVAPFLSASSDYSLGLSATVHYFLTKTIAVGTGLGGQILLISLSRLPQTDAYSQTMKGAIGLNRYYKPLMPVLPVEISLKFEKVLVNVRYEYGLLNRLKSDLREYKTDRFSLLTFEIGFKVK